MVCRKRSCYDTRNCFIDSLASRLHILQFVTWPISIFQADTKKNLAVPHTGLQRVMTRQRGGQGLRGRLLRAGPRLGRGAQLLQPAGGLRQRELQESLRGRRPGSEAACGSSPPPRGLRRPCARSVGSEGACDAQWKPASLAPAAKPLRGAAAGSHSKRCRIDSEACEEKSALKYCRWVSAKGWKVTAGGSRCVHPPLARLGPLASEQLPRWAVLLCLCCSAGLKKPAAGILKASPADVLHRALTGRLVTASASNGSAGKSGEAQSARCVSGPWHKGSVKGQLREFPPSRQTSAALRPCLHVALISRCFLYILTKCVCQIEEDKIGRWKHLVFRLLWDCKYCVTTRWLQVAVAWFFIGAGCEMLALILKVV